MSDLTILSAAFYDSPDQYKHLVDSCRQLGLNLVLFGQGEPWRWWRHKTERTLDTLRRVATPYVLVTDSGDAFMCHGEEEIMRRYLKFGGHLVIGTEEGCWPAPELKPRYPVGSSRYVNGGGYMGTAQMVQALLEEMLAIDDSNEDEQYRMTLAYLDNSDRICLDSHSSIFLTMSDNPADGDPCQMHFNGRTRGIEEWYKLMLS